MTETATAPAPKSPKAKVSKPKVKPNHPPVSSMVVAAIKALKERNGSSLQAVKKWIAANHKVDIEKITPFIRKFVKGAITKGVLIQCKGHGASGSFKLAKKEEKPKKKAVKKATKPKSDKPKTPKKKASKPATSSAAGEKKPKPKKAKSPAKKAASPKKAAAKPKVAKKAVKKSPAKAKAPKAKPAAKKPATKKASPKK